VPSYDKQAENENGVPTLHSQMKHLQSLLFTNVYTTWRVPGVNKVNSLQMTKLNKAGFPSVLAEHILK
jgi:hypothetical protein